MAQTNRLDGLPSHLRRRPARTCAGRRVAGGALLILALALGSSTARAATNIDVGASGMSAYVINSANNPTLTLVRGQSYTFTVSVGGHPFWITTARGAGDVNANAFNTGVTNNGASPGVIGFSPTATTPATLVYQCGFHDPMGGTINIVSPPSVPSSGRFTTVALGVFLLGLTVAAYSRRRSRRA